MEATVYEEMDRLETAHWWFTARRAILDRLIKNMRLPAEAAILEAGCGTGGNLNMLSGHGQVWAMELDDQARSFAGRKNTPAQIEVGKLPDEIPFGERSFDLIVLLDVLEHIDDDNGTLAALRRRLKPNGILLVTVPAYKALWSSHDEIHHHKRRYRRRELVALLRTAGFAIQYSSYFNFFLAPLIFTIRFALKLVGGGEESDAKMPSPGVNSLLRGFFAAERFLLGRLRFPFGISIVVMAKRAAHAS